MLCTPVFCLSIGKVWVFTAKNSEGEWHTTVNTTHDFPEGALLVTTIKSHSAESAKAVHHKMVQEIFEELWEVDVYTGEFVYVG